MAVRAKIGANAVGKRGVEAEGRRKERRPPFVGGRVGPSSPLFTPTLHPHHPTHTHTPQAVKLKTKKRPKKITPSDKKHVGATYPPLPPPPPAYTVLSSQ